MSYVTSCLIYYVVFFIAGCFFRAAEHTSDNRNNKRMIAIGILILCLFSGIRGVSVGADTDVVVHYRFDNTRLYSSWRSIMTPGNEPFITLLGYIVKKVFNNYRVFLFLLSLLFQLPLGIIAYKLRNKLSISAFMTVYMFMFYQYGMNIHKQCIATAWLLLAVVCFREKRIVTAIILAAFATLFHGTVFIGIALFAGVYIISSSKSKTLRYFVIAMSAVVAVVILLNWRSVASYILGSDKLSDDYTSYIAIAAGESGQRYTSFHYKTYVSVIIRLILMVLIIHFYIQSNASSDNDIKFYMYCTVIGSIIYTILVFMFKMYIGDRVTLYLDICQILTISMLIKRSSPINKLDSNDHVLRISTSGPSICMLYCFFYNFVYFMVINYCRTLPYVL